MFDTFFFCFEITDKSNSFLYTQFLHCHTLYLQSTYSLHTRPELVLHCYKHPLIHLFLMGNLLAAKNGVGWVSDPDLFGSTGLTWVMPSLHTNLPYIKSNC